MHLTISHVVLCERHTQNKPSRTIHTYVKYMMLVECMLCCALCAHIVSWSGNAKCMIWKIYTYEKVNHVTMLFTGIIYYIYNNKYTERQHPWEKSAHSHTHTNKIPLYLSYNNDMLNVIGKRCAFMLCTTQNNNNVANCMGEDAIPKYVKHKCVDVCA